jgi:hypothetical protein
VKLMESRHEFRCKILLYSSDLVDNAHIQIRVAPTRPDLAANANLSFTTRSFLSRARMPGEGKRKAPAEPTTPATAVAATAATAAPTPLTVSSTLAAPADPAAAEPAAAKPAAPVFRSLGAPDDSEEMVFRSMGADSGSGDDDEGASPHYAPLSAEPQGLKQEQEQDEAPRAPPSARVQNAEARARLQGMLDALESRQPLPSGPALVEALRMCRIGA